MPAPYGYSARRRETQGGVAVRRLMGAAVGVALAVALGCAQAAPAFVQGCGGTSWVGGATNVCEGKVVYRDYVYDDEGADTGGIGYDAAGTQSAFGTLAAPAGDQRYDAADTNSAALVRLELARAGDRVDVVALLNALRKPGSTILALAVDTDDDPATGGGDWGDLGVTSRGWDKLYKFATGDPRTNTIRGSFPLPAAKRWRVQAVTVQAATNTVMNVAFRGVDERAAYNLDYTNPSPYPGSGRGAWFEDNQAAALAAGDISQFGTTVESADLSPKVTRLQSVGPGLHERVYT